MTTQPNSSPSVQTSKYISAGSAYLVTVGILYLWGYWPRFGINILEYLSLTDVVKLTAYPVASAFVFLAIGAVFGELMVSDPSVTPESIRRSHVGRFFRWAAPVITPLYIVGTFALFMWGPETKWQVLPILVAMPLYVAAKRAGLLSELSHDSTRSVLVFLLVLLPLWAYGQGRTEAQHIRDGKKYTYLTKAPADTLPIEDPAKAQTRIKYLGHAGGFFFLLAADNKTVILLDIDKTNGLHLKTHDGATHKEDR